MSVKQTMAAGVMAVLVGFSTPEFCSAMQVEVPPIIQQNLSKEWQEMQAVQQQIDQMMATLHKKHEELRTLAEQKNVKISMIRYHDLMQKVHILNETNDKLMAELQSSIQAKDEERIKELLFGLTMHKQFRLQLLKDADKQLSDHIQELKQK